MSIANSETNPTQRRIGILLAQCCPVTTDPIKRSTYNQKAIEKPKGLSTRPAKTLELHTISVYTLLSELSWLIVPLDTTTT